MLRKHLDKNKTEAGCDEAGRGCLAGPVFAAAVILPTDFTHPLLNDSKALTEKQRMLLRPIIEEVAVSWAVANMDNKEIDELNILRASIMSMHKAIGGLKKRPQSLLIDGNRFYKYKDIPHRCIVKGDGKYTAIAAASILAKTHRDDFMTTLHNRYPEYLWSSNKGYATQDHRKAIQQHGITKYHRRSFRLLPQQLSIFD